MLCFAKNRTASKDLIYKIILETNVAISMKIKIYAQNSWSRLWRIYHIYEQNNKNNNYSSQQYFGSEFSASYAYPCIGG